MITLKGMTWDHRRAVDPLVRTLEAFRGAHPGITVDWARRPLSGFEFQPVDDLAREYDLIVFDHPFCGVIVRTECLLPLDGLLAGSDRLFVGPSLDAYRYAGRVWGLPIDAAAQVAVARPDLMAKLGAETPQTWDGVLALGAAAQRRGLRLAIGLEGVHSLMTFFTVMAGMGAPCATDPLSPLCERVAAGEALALLRAIVALCPREVFNWSSIGLHDAMSSRDDLAYCPAVYCYATYAEADRDRPLRFHDLPGVTGPEPAGSTIGGTGLGVSAACRYPEAALAYAEFMMEAGTQRAFAAHHGQPARIECWEDPEIDGRFGGCFAATRATMEHAWIRPRHDGYLTFQAKAGPLVEDHLKGGIAEADLLDALDALHRAPAA